MEVVKERPSYVRFERRPVEDRKASIERGHYTTRDEDFAIVTPHGSTDEIPRVVSEWFRYLDQQVTENRVPFEWADMYRLAYEKWKRGEEVPLEGTPIKEWSVLSPSQRQNLIACNVLTVEDLAALNESGLARVGMESHTLRMKAQKWLEASNGPGKLAERMTSMELQLGQLLEQNKAQSELISRLRAENESLKKTPAEA